jgi:hypothetical protein
MNKFKLKQRVSSPTFGEGVVKDIYSDGDLCVEFDKPNDNVLHSCDDICESARGWYYLPDGRARGTIVIETLTPVGPYEGERVTNVEFGDGTIVETETGFGGRLILVQFDKMDRRLHDGNGYCRGTYLAGTCWSFTPSKYGTEIKPLSAPEPAPATVGDVERLIAAHVAEHHSPVNPAPAAISEGWTAIEKEPPLMYDVELLLKDGTQRYGFLNNGRCVLFEKGAKPVGTGKNCVTDTCTKRNAVVPASDVLAWRHITATPATPAVPEGWNGGHPGNQDNVEIMFDDGKTSVGYWGVYTLNWYEFEKEYWSKALSDKEYCDHCDTCQKPVIGWRVPQPEPEPFKRGERVVTRSGKKGTFVRIGRDGSAVILLDDGLRGFGISLDDGFWIADLDAIKREAKQ